MEIVSNVCLQNQADINKSVTTILKLPPYGNYLHQLQQKNLVPKNDVYIFTGRYAWQKARNFHVMRKGTMCLPSYADPSDYIWPVKYCDILIFDTSETPLNLIINLAKCLLNDGANIVRYNASNGNLTVFKKEF